MCSVPFVASAFYGDGPLISAIVTVTHDNGKGLADEKIEVLGVSSEGYIQGSEVDKGQVDYTFAELKKIEFVINGSKYLVTTKDGVVHTLKFGLIKTHRTSPTFDCYIKNGKTAEKEEAMLDAGKFVIIEFTEKAADEAAKTDDSTK